MAMPYNPLPSPFNPLPRKVAPQLPSVAGGYGPWARVYVVSRDLQLRLRPHVPLYYGEAWYWRDPYGNVWRSMRLPMRNAIPTGPTMIRGLPRVGVGDAAAFAQAATDLQNQIALPIQAADSYLSQGDTASALQAYKAAGQVGAGTVGPEIDNAGAAAVTQSFTQFAWGLNGQLSAATDATAAQGIAHQMLVTYQDAIATGQASLANGGGGTQPAPTPATGWSAATTQAANALMAYFQANGVPPIGQSVSVVSTFQGAFDQDANNILSVDGKYGPLTQSALATVLGSAPAANYGGGTTPPNPPNITPSVTPQPPGGGNAILAGMGPAGWLVLAAAVAAAALAADQFYKSHGHKVGAKIKSHARRMSSTARRHAKRMTPRRRRR